MSSEYWNSNGISSGGPTRHALVGIYDIHAYLAPLQPVIRLIAFEVAVGAVEDLERCGLRLTMVE
jgi:hypothetical protein